MKLAFIALESPFRPYAWSGIPFHSYRALRERIPGITVIDTPYLDRIVSSAAKLRKVGWLPSREPLLSHAFSRFVNRRLEELQPDALVAVGAAHKIAFIDRRWPLLFATDAMFNSVVHYYESYSSLSARSLRLGEFIQRELLQRVDRALVTSEWARAGAIAAYQLPPEKIFVQPMGANLRDVPRYSEPDMRGPLKFLFVGYDWQRKGGDIAIDVWRAVRQRLQSAELHIVGCTPSVALNVEGVFVYGVLNKTRDSDYKKFVDLFRKSSFFIMPSRQETFGLVYCEAAAFGRPAIAISTGGIGEIVEDGRTGLLFAPGTDPESIADRVVNLWQSTTRYLEMGRMARQRFESRLNWEVWAEAAVQHLREILA